MAAKKKNTGLGKGLEALFGDLEQQEASESEKENSNINNIELDQIKPNSGQPRKTFDKDAIKDLAASITEHGLIQPIIVRPLENGYEIVAGERRYRAAREAGLKEIPCIIRELTDEENMLFAIIENMQREDLNPIEEAEGIRNMISVYGLTQEEVSKSVGKSRPYITNIMRLLKLPKEVQVFISEGQLSSGHGRTLLGVDDEDKILMLAKKTISEGMSVRALEELITGEKKATRKKPRKIRKSPDIVRVEEDLKKSLGTRVNLKQSGKKGKIEVEYYSRDELERLIELLTSI